ncbi:MAG TPA: MFS transporter [Bacteroidales bacterium]|nr:MFS transporter [Bacteroidales bacterium]HRZ50150.1 MFS transporter [Bacteroidales bacterium]
MEENNRKQSVTVILPVLLTFFVMSFCDLVGIGVDYAKADFNLSNTMAQLIPSAVFIWFFFFSVPVGVLQDRIGKKNMVNIGMLITAAGLLLPFVAYTYPTLLAGFVLIGIGNTIMQVSANPLMLDVVRPERRSSYLSFSQFIKAIGSMVAPYVAAFFAARFGDWKLAFLSFGIVSLISVLWLYFIPVTEVRSDEKRATFMSALGLLKIPYVVMMVLGIFFVVGIDVGVNSVSGQFLMEKLGMDAQPAKEARSLYFFGKMLGTFAAAFLLARIKPGKFLLFSSLATLVTILAFIFSPSVLFAQVLMFLIGISAAAIFPLIFSITVSKHQKYSNEISGLMIMAVSGGAVIPPLIGYLTDSISVTAGMFVLVACAVYLIILSVPARNKSLPDQA